LYATAIPFNQSHRQGELPAQPRFRGRHPTVIALMVVTCEMKETMQGQNLDLLRSGMSKTVRILSRDIR
jgi:hypothetical protein